MPQDKYEATSLAVSVAISVTCNYNFERNTAVNHTVCLEWQEESHHMLSPFATQLCNCKKALSSLPIFVATHKIVVVYEMPE
jgi:hypothetical protein